MSDKDALAQIIHRHICPDFPADEADCCAETILESDWLAEHDDRIRRETLRQVALKLDDLVEGDS